ncbi:MAG: glucosyltransferase domain-containing protein [Clostridia bacterium]|nr:glucosyltransferase domain-containing protein [Clostridia bacterium]
MTQVWFRMKNGLFRFRFSFISAMACGLLAHLPAFTNKYLAADDVFSLFSKNATISSGRWALPLISAIFPDYSMPWLNGILTLLLLSAAACITACVFDLKRPVEQVLCGGALTVFPALTSTFGYMFTAPAYAAALLLIVLGVYAVRKQSVVSCIAACVLFTFSFGIYQAYISFAACLICLILIKEFLFSERDMKSILLYALRMALVAAAAGLLYLGINRLVMAVSGTAYNEYAAQNLYADVSIPQRLLLAYTSFFAVFRYRYGYIPTRFCLLLYAVCIAGSALILVTRWFRCRGIGRKAAVFVLFMLFPLAVNCLFLFVAPAAIHGLTQYAFVTVFLLFLMAVGQCGILDRPRLRAVCKGVTAAAVALILICNIFFANQVYLDYQMRTDRTIADYEQIVTLIEADPSFTEGKKVAVIGRMYWSTDFYEYFGNADTLTGVKNTVPGMYSWREVMKYRIGFDADFATNEEIDSIRALPAYADMPCFPYHGSVAEIGDYIVVKLSGDTAE